MEENFFVELETESEPEFSDRFLGVIEEQFGFVLKTFDDGVGRFFDNPRIGGYWPFMANNPRVIYRTCSMEYRRAKREGTLKLTD